MVDIQKPMRYNATVLLFFALVAVPAGRANTPACAQLPGLTEQQQSEQDLLCASENFNGEDSLAEIATLIDKGVNINICDSEGNTALLLLCHTLELDYRYRNDPHFAQAVDQAFCLLLSKGANAMHENKKGCNAVFFLQSKPELKQKLCEQKLLSKELAVRIPYEPLALGKYIKLRINQVRCTTHAENIAYLSRIYCTPAYDRVMERLQRYINAESAAGMPQGALADCLAFLRLANPSAAAEFVNNLIYWEHSEHFIEEIPAEILTALHQTQWQVPPPLLQKALVRLESLLPNEGEDMISCNSARPMGLILEMLEQQNREQATPLVERYCKARDPELAYYAYCILLQRNALPCPEPEELAAHWQLSAEADCTQKLGTEQRKVYEGARVDAAMRKGTAHQLAADELKRAEAHFRSMELTRHAEAIAMLFEGEQLSRDPFILQRAYHRYAELVSPAPRATLARYILEHPQHFKPNAAH